MTKKVIRFVQGELNARGYDAGEPDGVIGSRTIAALDEVDGLSSDWSAEQKAVGFVQLIANEDGIDAGPVDGLWGPQTSYAFDELVARRNNGHATPSWRPEELVVPNPNDWPSQSDEADIIRRYGEPGENQARIRLPYTHRLSWDTGTQINSFQCHELVHDSLLRVLTRVLDHYGTDEIKKLRLDLWGGCLNVRAMRGGTRRSMHSWGIAVDYDPNRNALGWGRDRAAFARPEYAAWWRFWEEEGWTSLGRTRNIDWMHVQAARL